MEIILQIIVKILSSQLHACMHNVITCAYILRFLQFNRIFFIRQREIKMDQYFSTQQTWNTMKLPLIEYKLI